MALGRVLALVRPRIGLGAQRADHHHHVAAVLARLRFDGAQLGDVLGELLQQLDAEFGTLLLTAAELDDGLDLVALAQELLGVAGLGLVVVLVDLQAEADLLEDRVHLVLARLTGLHRGLVLVLAEIHQLAHRRLGRGGHLHEIQVRLGGEPEGVLDADDADLFAVRADQADFRNADTLVDAGIADGAAPLCETTGDPAPTGGALGNEEGLPCADADGGLDTVPQTGPSVRAARHDAAVPTGDPATRPGANRTSC